MDIERDRKYFWKDRVTNEEMLDRVEKKDSVGHC